MGIGGSLVLCSLRRTSGQRERVRCPTVLLAVSAQHKISPPILFTILVQPLFSVIPILLSQCPVGTFRGPHGGVATELVYCGAMFPCTAGRLPRFGVFTPTGYCDVWCSVSWMALPKRPFALHCQSWSTGRYILVRCLYRDPLFV